MNVRGVQRVRICKPGELCRHIQARHTENSVHPLHCVPFYKKREHAIHFRGFITSTASQKILFAIVLLAEQSLRLSYSPNPSGEQTKRISNVSRHC
jgi:hypothetical protein